MTDEYKTYLASKEWKAKRLSLFKARGRVCEKCGATACVLQVHHLTYARIFKEEDDDLQIVCVPCHEEIHGIVRGKKKRKKEKRKGVAELIRSLHNPHEETKGVKQSKKAERIRQQEINAHKKALKRMQRNTPKYQKPSPISRSPLTSTCREVLNIFQSRRNDMAFLIFQVMKRCGGKFTFNETSAELSRLKGL